jgi:high-affinity iron transporter
VLVFREGLECILVLAALTASFRGSERKHYRPILAGVAIAFAATLATWAIAVRILSDISENVSALQVQAGTGLLAVIVLLIVMNWFFHRTYWTGWISYHNQKKQELLRGSRAPWHFLYGMVLLGFTSFYREGFEVVLFLQSYRLRLGTQVVGEGVVLGSLAAGVVAVLTFVVHRHLPYRKMLVATGVMLGAVLLVMVGEQADEMQLAGWLSRTEIPWLAPRIPSWMNLWFAVSATVETLGAQALAAALVVGSYLGAEWRSGSQGKQPSAAE